MITINAISCPKCGASITIDEDKKISFCQYCGTQLVYDDGVQRIEINQHIYQNIDQHNYQHDEARLREILFKETLDQREQEKERKSKLIWKYVFLVFSIICLITAIIAIVIAKNHPFHTFTMFMLIIIGITTLIASYLTALSFRKSSVFYTMPGDFVRRIWGVYIGFLVFYGFVFLVGYIIINELFM